MNRHPLGTLENQGLVESGDGEAVMRLRVHEAWTQPLGLRAPPVVRSSSVNRDNIGRSRIVDRAPNGGTGP